MYLSITLLTSIPQINTWQLYDYEIYFNERQSLTILRNQKIATKKGSANAKPLTRIEYLSRMNNLVQVQTDSF